MFFVDDNQKATFIVPYDFPLAVHETALRDKPMGFTPWHWHEEVQFSFVLEGSMVTTAQGVEHLLRPGDGFFINSNLSHMTKPADAAVSARYLSLNVSPKLLTLFRGSVVEQRYFLPYVNDPGFQFMHLTPETPWQEQILAAMRRLFSVVQAAAFGFELETYAQLLVLWKMLLEHLGVEEAANGYVESAEAQQIMSHVHDNYGDAVTLSGISQSVHRSAEECCRLFKETYGCTIFTYLGEYRIQQSIPLLADPSLSVSAISERCGFNSLSYFIKCFREKVGATPLQYRKNLAK